MIADIARSLAIDNSETKLDEVFNAIREQATKGKFEVTIYGKKLTAKQLQTFRNMGYKVIDKTGSTKDAQPVFYFNVPFGEWEKIPRL